MNQKTTLFSLAAASFLSLAGCKSSDTSTAASTTAAAQQTPTKQAPIVPTFTYPETRKTNQTDNYHGTEVADPYRWLEDMDSPETEAWVHAQNKVTFKYLEGIPYRTQIRERLEKLWNYPKYGAPVKEGDRYYFHKNDGLQNQAVMYVQKSLEAEPEVFLDPNKLSEDGTTSLSTISFSKDAKYVVYGTSAGGSDWNQFNVMETATKNLLTDKLDWIKFSGASWHGNGFYYSRYDAPAEGNKMATKNEFHKIYYHKIGTPQSQDKLIFENKDKPLRIHSAGTTEDERFLILTASEGTSNNNLSVKDLSKANSKFMPIINSFDSQYRVVDNQGDKLIVHTNSKAPNYKVVLIDPKNPDPKNWKTLIPETDNLLQSIGTVGDKLIASYLKDAASQVLVFDRNGKQLHEVKLPAIGTVGGFSGKKEDKETFFTFTSFTYPPTIYRYNVNTNTATVFRKSEANIQPELYETKQGPIMGKT